MALECRSVRELLVIPETQAHASRGEAEVTPNAERVDGVAGGRLIRRDAWSTLVGGLPLLVADHTYLQRHVLPERQHLGQGIVQADRLTRFDAGPLLTAVELVHLKRRHQRPSVCSQVDRLARRDYVGPVARANIVIRPRLEPAGGRQESVD